LQRIHPLRERVSGMQGSVQGCIRRFMLQKEAGCARLLPQRVGSSGLLSDTQGNGHGEPCAESIHHMGDTLRLIMDLAGLQDESVHAESHGPLRRLDNLSLVKTVTFQGRIRRTQAAVSAVPFATVREFDQASDKDMLSLFPGPHLVGALTQSLVRRFEKQFQNIVPLHTLSPAFNPSFNTRSCGKGNRQSIRRMGYMPFLAKDFIALVTVILSPK
jgi:hypothetical protein